MNNTIAVKGVGRVSRKPDLIVVSMEMQTEHIDYDKTMELAAERIQLINESLKTVGLEKEEIKTTSFNVHTKNESVKDKNGNYKSVFKGYACNHNLKVEFDFDTKMLARVLSAISECLAKPEFSISFTVKDQSAIKDELLESATHDAKRKAEILCASSGVKLGKLVSIDYNWSEINFYSDTDYIMRESFMAKECLAMDIQPDDIKAKDTVAFIWEII